MSVAPHDERMIFETALALSNLDSRGQYLDETCGNDRQLRRRIESLLSAAEDGGGFMRKQAASSFEIQPDGNESEGPNQMIGTYKLLEKIGEGGFGDVYMAEQQRPVIRKVALKMIKPGMDTKQIIGRFEVERQALAMMEHANIAKIHDAGSTESGRPYFVMEVVRGIPVTEYCDDRSLSTVERLKIFMEICDAIQHAHQKGIIHRDIKPSNILVSTNDDRPVPKVIDFGIAKATQGRLTEKTLFTQYQQFIGTPAYMSPEQAQFGAVDVDTRSDIYSLGVLLYELLVGKPPFDPEELRQCGYDEIRRRIREVEPPVPSTCLRIVQEITSRTWSDA